MIETNIKNKQILYDSDKNPKSRMILTEREFKNIFDIISSNLGEAMSKKFLDFMALMIEDKKKYGKLMESEKNVSAKIQEKENQYKQKIQELKEKDGLEISKIKEHLKEVEEYIKNFEERENLAKDWVIEDILEGDKESFTDMDFVDVLRHAKINRKHKEKTRKGKVRKEISEGEEIEDNVKLQYLSEDIEDEEPELPNQEIFHRLTTPNPNSEEYIRSEKCICGHPKKWGSKGCKECKRMVDRNRKRNGTDMDFEWNNLWKSLGDIQQK